MTNEPNSKPSDQTPQANDAAKNAAIEFIRRRVDQAYKTEPNLEAEAKTEKDSKTHQPQLSKHQRYAKELVKSAQPLAEIHKAWHYYYAELSDEEKHEVWREFYKAHGQAEAYETYTKGGTVKPAPRTYSPNKIRRVIRKRPRRAKYGFYKPSPEVHSLLVGLSAGFIAIMIILFGFFNERFIAPFIQPSRAVTSLQLISDNASLGSESEVIIPKINVEIPVVYGLNTIDEKTIDTALEGGVVHYADTAEPGENGNVVVVGHSSNNIFNKGHYKFAFVLLSRLENGDTFYLQKDGKRYTYQVYDKKIVKPEDVSVLNDASKPAIATLITCDPPGTSLNRLVVIGEQISPNPADNKGARQSPAAAQTKTIPGNAPSLWSRLWNWFSQ